MKRFLLSLILVVVAGTAYSLTVTNNDFISGQTIVSAEIDQNFDEIDTAVTALETTVAILDIEPMLYIADDDDASATYTDSDIEAAFTRCTTDNPAGGCIIELEAQTYTDVALVVPDEVVEIRGQGMNRTHLVSPEDTKNVAMIDIDPNDGARFIYIHDFHMDGNKQTTGAGATVSTHRGIAVTDSVSTSPVMDVVRIERMHIESFLDEQIFITRTKRAFVRDNLIEFAGCFDETGTAESDWTPNGVTATEVECGTWGTSQADEGSQAGRVTNGVGIEIGRYMGAAFVENNDVRYFTYWGIQTQSAGSEDQWPNGGAFRNNRVGWGHEGGIATVQANRWTIENNYIHDMDTPWADGTDNVGKGISCRDANRGTVIQGNTVERVGGIGIRAGCGCGFEDAGNTDTDCKAMTINNVVSQACQTVGTWAAITTDPAGPGGGSIGDSITVANNLILDSEGCASDPGGVEATDYTEIFYETSDPVGPQFTLADSDATPTVEDGTNFITGATTFTYTDFDYGNESVPSGKIVYVESAGAITYDCTGAGFACGSTDIVTASGDVTSWVYDGADWRLIAYMDQDTDMGTDGGSSAFSAITTGTNTTANMTVGSGANFLPSGTGVILATSLDAVGAGAVTIGSADVTGITATSAGLITLDAGTNGTDVVIVGDDWDVTAAGAATFAGAVTAASFTADPSATPTSAWQDSDMGGTPDTNASQVINCPTGTTAGGDEDCDMAFNTQVAGSLTEAFRIDTTDAGVQTVPFAVATTLQANDVQSSEIATIVESMYWGAGAMSADGTQCAAPAEVTIGSWGKQYTIICADNDASTITGSTHMPDGWDAGTVTFALSYIQDAADTSALNADVAARCAGTGETPAAYGTEIAIDDAAVTGTDAIDITTSAAVTAAGTCSAGDYLQWQIQLDATGTTTAAATLNIVGVKMEYTSNVGD